MSRAFAVDARPRSEQAFLGGRKKIRTACRIIYTTSIMMSSCSGFQVELVGYRFGRYGVAVLVKPLIASAVSLSIKRREARLQENITSD